MSPGEREELDRVNRLNKYVEENAIIDFARVLVKLKIVRDRHIYYGLIKRLTGWYDL